MWKFDTKGVQTVLISSRWLPNSWSLLFSSVNSSRRSVMSFHLSSSYLFLFTYPSFVASHPTLLGDKSSNGQNPFHTRPSNPSWPSQLYLLYRESFQFNRIIACNFPIIPLVQGSILTGWWYTYPTEKWWTSSVGMMTFPNIWKVNQLIRLFASPNNLLVLNAGNFREWSSIF